jgi:mannose-6-phosphate isomerase-like protein (cupin superfamily)
MSVYKNKKHLKTAWVARSSQLTTQKPWGREESWSGFNGIHGKILFIDKDKKTSLKFNKMKTEVLFLKAGKVEVLFGNESSFEDAIEHPLKTEILDPGDALLVQSGCPYRLIGIEDSEIIEIGNYNSDQPVRVLDDYGRESEDIEDLLEAISEHT